MEEARAVLDRIDRIERLEASGAPAADLLAEVRALLGEAERWARRERVDLGEVLERSEEALTAAGSELVDQPA